MPQEPVQSPDKKIPTLLTAQKIPTLPKGISESEENLRNQINKMPRELLRNRGEFDRLSQLQKQTIADTNNDFGTMLT